MKTIELLNDPSYLGDLLNSFCRPGNCSGQNSPVHPEWIEPERSAFVTDAYHKLLPPGMPYLSTVQVECNPDTLFNGTCVDSPEKRQRYIVITIVPDTELPYNKCLPLFLYSGVNNLYHWEMVRATLDICERGMDAVISDRPVPPIMNNARIEWVTLFLGRQPFQGITELSRLWMESIDDDGIEVDVHLYDVRRMKTDPVLQRLIDAYDSDCPLGTTTG